MAVPWSLVGAMVVGGVATLLAFPPAQWVAMAIDSATGGRVRIAQAQGTAWKGSGVLVFADGDAGKAGALHGMALPGRLGWDVDPLQLLGGTVALAMTHPSLDKKLAVELRADRMRLSDGRLTLPAMELSALGSPWNALRPSGAFAADWKQLEILPRGLNGKIGLDLAQAASPISPVKPLGSYRIDAEGQGGPLTVRMRTVSGSLQLTADGQLASGVLRIAGDAGCSAQCEELTPLLSVIGRKEGERYKFRLGQ